MESLRLKKVARAYLDELSKLLLTGIQDPRLHGVFISDVRPTPDLRLARVYFGFNGDRAREKEVLKAFKKSKGYLKQELALKIKLRFVPELNFFYDETLESTERIEKLFQKLESEKKVVKDKI